ncbi:MAG: pinensin family lanthipeptide [Saprospiraceae bacterium]|nr:pinensin family lanthipeptide [Saprospiraceae bacterium]MDW8484366.1 pinensin family lanthipeptide [Saprospiraceae bacterium]
MKKTKLSLQELQIQSFATVLDAERMRQIKGGRYEVRGRRFTYRTRWTSVDTRSDELGGTTTPLSHNPSEHTAFGG